MTMGLGICTSILKKSTAILAILKTADILLQDIFQNHLKKVNR